MYVRFIHKNGQCESIGTFIDTQHIECTTPNFSELGCGIVNVELTIGDYRAANTVEYEVFALTDPHLCVPFGYTIMNEKELLINTNHSFLIISIDVSGLRRDSGGDIFVVELVENNMEVKYNCKIIDNDNGSYTCIMCSNVEGDFNLNIYLKTGPKELIPLRESPYIYNYVLDFKLDFQKMVG